MSRTLMRAATGFCGALVLTAASLAVGALPASAAEDCAVEYAVASDWGSGFIAEVTITNTSGAQADGWTVAWTFPGDQQATNAWNATLAQNGAAVTASASSWNSSLPAGDAASFGFQATGAGATPANIACSLNGAPVEPEEPEEPGEPEEPEEPGEPGEPEEPGEPGEPGGTARIMALGDSITGSPGCWRALLWRDLTNAGYTDIDFVGSRTGDGCGFPYDGEHEGHGGLLVTNIADQNQLPGWLSISDPDIVLMHFGTNDVWSARSTQAILNAYSTLVAQMRANNPDMTILVAQIIPMDSARSCAECGQRVQDLNAAIPGWAASQSTTRSPVIVVDQWTGFVTADDTYDGVHPSSSGDAKIAQNWFSALTPLLD